MPDAHRYAPCQLCTLPKDGTPQGCPEAWENDLGEHLGIIRQPWVADCQDCDWKSEHATLEQAQHALWQHERNPDGE